jgi:hypothetical protein
VLYCEAGERRGKMWGPVYRKHGIHHVSFLLPCTNCCSVIDLILPLLSSFQAAGDTELSLYDSEEDSPSYWDLEQVSRGSKSEREGRELPQVQSVRWALTSRSEQSPWRQQNSILILL